jgi:glycosyltransferase involved in cell wall biosynthesis
MRILVASDQWHPDLKGGSARVVTETSRRLAERGHEVTVVCPAHAGEPARTTTGRLSILRILPRSIVPQTFSDPFFARRHAVREGSRGRFDVLVAHQATVATGLTTARLDAPLTLVYHASAVRELRYLRSRLPTGRRRLVTYALEPPLLALERAAVRRADRIVILSEFSRGLLGQDHPGALRRIVLARGGVDTEAFAPADDASGIRARLGIPAEPTQLLLTVRRLEPRMGLEELLVATRRLADSRRLVLAIVGGGSLERELRRLSVELGLGETVRFVGRTSDGELIDWYRAADLFVLPTAAYEGFGMVTAEALACGTPVVGTPVGATPELLRPLDPHLVASGTDSVSLARAVSGALERATPDFRHRCREYAVERFAWGHVISAWENALDQARATSTFDA